VTLTLVLFFLLQDVRPGRRECVGHSVFHIDIAETRNCRTCGAKDHAGKETGHQVKKMNI